MFLSGSWKDKEKKKNFIPIVRVSVPGEPLIFSFLKLWIVLFEVQIQE